MTANLLLGRPFLLFGLGLLGLVVTFWSLLCVPFSSEGDKPECAKETTP